MRNILFFVLFVIGSILLVGSRYFIFPEKIVKIESEKEILQEKKTLLSGYENGVWDWVSIKNEDYSSFLSSLKSRGVNVVYLNIGDYVDLYEMEKGLERDEKIKKFSLKIRDYISQAKQNEIRVEALAGNEKWGNSSHRYLNKIVIDFVREFNLNNPEYAFSGIQFDIEPYNQKDFNNKNSRIIFKEYLDTIEKIVSDFNNLQKESPQIGSLRLGFAIPHWFDGEEDRARKINWQGEEKYIFQHILNRLNRVQNGYLVIMAYRNFTEGEDGIVQHVQNEIKFAHSYIPRVKIIIGQETSDVKPKKITYFDKDFNSMVDELKKVGLTFENYSNFAGFAFNNANSFLELKQYEIEEVE
jgi:hypothetical protein